MLHLQHTILYQILSTGFFPSEVLWGHAYCDLSMRELKKQWTSTEFHVPSLHSPYKKIVFDFCNPFWRCLKCTNIGFFTLKLSSVCLKQQKKNNIYSPFTGKTCIYLCFLFCCKGHSMKKGLELNLLNFIRNFLLCCLQQWLVNNTQNFAFLKLFFAEQKQTSVKV